MCFAVWLVNIRVMEVYALINKVASASLISIRLANKLILRCDMTRENSPATMSQSLTFSEKFL